jgi:hypothetical protein
MNPITTHTRISELCGSAQWALYISGARTLVKDCPSHSVYEKSEAKMAAIDVQ